MVKVRGRNSNGKTVKQTAENWHVPAFVTSWCHTGATSQSWQGHATESRYSWSAGISPRQVMTWCWHDDDCDRHLAHYRPCAFFSMFLVTRPRSFRLKTKKKKKKTEDNKMRACWPKVSCAQHLHVTVALADSIEWTSQFLHGYWEEKEELSPSPIVGWR